MMIIRSPLGAIIGVIITLIVIFVIVLPQLNKADQVTDQALQQTQQALDQSQQALDQSQAELDASGDQGQIAVPKDEKATSQAIGQCVTEAGTDVNKLRACQQQFAP